MQPEAGNSGERGTPLLCCQDRGSGTPHCSMPPLPAPTVRGNLATRVPMNDASRSSPSCLKVNCGFLGSRRWER